MFIVLIQNITLLVSATVIYTIIIRRWEKGSLSYSIYSGILFGFVAVLGMMMPLTIEPGVIFDGRSIVLSIAGLLAGPVTAWIAFILTALYRISIGGPGMIVGIVTAGQSALFGFIYHYLIKKRKISLTPLNLIIFSLIVHFAMLYEFSYIPGLTSDEIIYQLAPPILILYPLATLVIYYIIGAQEGKMRAEMKLEENERRLQKTQEIANIGSWEYDLVSNRLTWSPEVYNIFGVSEWQFKTSYENFLQLVHPDDRESVDRAYRDSINEGRDCYEVEHRLTRQDNGEIRYVIERGEHLRDGSGNPVRSLGMVQDITERKLYESQLRYISLHDQLTGLYNRAFFEEELIRMDRSRDYPVTILSADLDGLKLINDTLGHARGDDMLVASAEILRKSLRLGDVLARVGGDEFAAILPKTSDIGAEGIGERITDNLAQYNSGKNTLPLSISFGLATSEDHDKGDLHDLVKKADDLMYRDKLNHRAKTRNQIVQALLTALSVRDFIAEGHVDRVRKKCRQMGLKLDLNARQLADLDLLAQVHDLGKVGIPDHILFKQGELTDEEWEVMRMHPEKGYRIATASMDLSGVAELILKHHERWDGEGYPLGLKGKEIPIECRILGIVDSFDAMTNDRPYSRPRAAEEALEEIKVLAGSQFDPQLVEAFISLSEAKK